MPTSEPTPASLPQSNRDWQTTSAAPAQMDQMTTIAAGMIPITEQSGAQAAPQRIKPSFLTEILRPDDLLTISVECYNLTPFGAGQLRRIDPHADAFLVFSFPPQHIAEQAYFEAYDISPKDHPDPQAASHTNPTKYPGDPTQTPKAPGASGSMMSGPSRLAFQLPSGVNSIPFTLESLLGWSQMVPQLAPVAKVGEPPKPEQLAAPPSIERPGALTTAIELPYRLFLSPGQDALWQHAVAPVTHAGRTELWHTRLVRPESGAIQELDALNTAPLRAIWSPDYAPPHDDMPRHSDDINPFMSSLTALDRHQIVVLTSAFTGYAYGSDPTPFVPSSIQAQRLMLSSLGGWLSSRGAWEHQPATSPFSSDGQLILIKSAKSSIWSRLGDLVLAPVRGVMRVFRMEKVGGITIQKPSSHPGWMLDAKQILDMSEWVHLATMGRDHYVKVIYEGHLLPFGHRAALVKITERKFQTQVDGPMAGAPVAWLRQHMYIVVREPEKRYDDDDTKSHTSGGRALPLTSIRLKTLVTPNIAYPYEAPTQINGTDGSFWIQVLRGGTPTDFNFSVSATDVEGRGVDFTTPMIFVSLADSVNSDKVQALREAYNPGYPHDPAHPSTATTDTITAADERRACVVRRQKMAFASASETGKGDTDLTTARLYFDPVPAVGDPGVAAGFVPVLDHALVSMPALEHLLGKKDPVRISLAQKYLDNNFDPHAGVFAELTDSTALKAKFTADQAGGISTPDLTVTGISRKLGPVAGDLDTVVSGTFDPTKYLPEAKLFGVVNVTDLVTSGGDLTKQAPQIVTTTDTGAKQMLTTMHWQPEIKSNPSLPLLKNTKGTMALTIDEQIVTPMLGSAPGTYSLQGSLTSFALDLANVLKIEFTSFNFSSRSGEKSHVAVSLDASKPITFEGSLEFVNRLSQYIPAGVFGDSGPSLNVSPTGVQVGYRLGLPPIEVAVFALHSVTLAAALDLPFEDGKPHLDVAFSSRLDPFILTVEALGGGGFLHLELDAEGVIMVEGSLEFGGEFALDIGVASGGVHIMGGIYVQLRGKASDLSGFVDVAGEVSVLGIASVSVDFNISLSYIKTADGKKQMQGRATMTVEVHVAFFSKSVNLKVERTYGSGADPDFGAVMTEGAWQEYADAFAA
jgi:hypothetical protein